MPNALTRTAGLRLGPIALDILFKHYFDRIKKEKAGDGQPFTQLHQDELLYDEVFNIAKRFFEVATHHSVEELQAFSNLRTLSSPTAHIARVTVPVSCCDEAAILLIQALGGEEHTSLLVGGTKWWQVRSVAGIPGEWSTARKDWEEAKKRQKASKKKQASDGDSSQDASGQPPFSTSEPSSTYDRDTDDMRCILFTHGGGYYFGSVDQERYCMQRLARKTKGRVFTINYRLAPQYPFPCALQDLIAAYLYLIKPPPDAPHQPVKPSRLVVAGDSAGGGLTLALLQVLRDTGQPLPTGGILISPWCDLTHSFPSVHTNTATDVLPLYGLSLHKPSTLWPPPPEEITHKIHTGIRQKVRQIIRGTDTERKACETTVSESAQDSLASSKPGRSDGDGQSVPSEMPVEVGATATLPSAKNQTISLYTTSGEQLEINSQIQLYTQNDLLGHPLVSPALSYLGGLPPLFIIASDKEVLRDEIIYSAHKAAFPSMFPLRDEALALYPPLLGIEERHGPTQVHLQVYDDTAHVLPILFPLTTPGKYCYRAMATFAKHITGMLPSSTETNASSSRYLDSVDEVYPNVTSPQQLSPTLPGDVITESPPALDNLGNAPETPLPASDTSDTHLSFSRQLFFSFRIKSVAGALSRSISEQSLRQGGSSQEGRSVGNTGKSLRRTVSMIETSVRYAGEANSYYNEEGVMTWRGGMIRERVSTQGIIRPLEPMDRLDALHVPPAVIGVLSEKTVRRYLEGKALFDQRYAKELLTIEKQRKRNIDLAKKDITHFQESQNGRAHGKQKETSRAFTDGLASPTGVWGWACADERPPPSSIVSRRDTDESRRLARIACRSVLQEEGYMSGNSLWTVIVNMLSVSPPKERSTSDTETAEPPVEQAAMKKSKSMFMSLREWQQKKSSS